ncbi:MAG: hypothetical protein WDM90_15755, partial [Ferruginibacter sp.]
LARFLYNYKNKYFLNASIRNDASSQIAPQNRNQIFWAVGAGWELTKEKFMEGIPQINFLKLKGSIGVLGNQTSTDEYGNGLNYPFYPQLNAGASAVFGTNPYSAARASYEPSRDLKWETVHADEIGFEANAFGNRLHFEANYFNKVTKNLMTYARRSSLDQV